MSAAALAQAAAAIRQIAPVTRYGSVVGVRGGLLEICGLGDAARVGARLRIASGSQDVLVEIAGMEGGRALCAAFSDIAGIATGARALLVGHQAVISPDDNWLGRVIDGLARPVDGRGALSRGAVARVVRGGPPNATARARVGRKIATVYGRSTYSRPSVSANDWDYSPARVSGNRCCCRCWRALLTATSPSSV